MALVHDRATATFAPLQLGATRHRTPEGYLLCEGVRLARTGPMLYSHDEMLGEDGSPIVEAPLDGAMITIQRDSDVLFAPDAIASFAGKPVTNDHPDGLVAPTSFQGVSVGVVLNPRQGLGAEAEYLIGDLLIMDAQAIEDVDAGKREVSAGYDADIEQIKPGLGRQTQIVGNHVALVKRGRAGPACAIQDGADEMKLRKRTILDSLRKAFKAKDEAALEAALGNAGDLMDDDEPGDEPQRVEIVITAPAPAAAAAEPVVDEVDPNEARFAKIEADLSTIAAAVASLTPAAAADPVTDAADDDKDEDKEADKKAVTDAMSKAEILVPGVKLPTMDAAASVKRSAVTDMRRTALKAAIADSDRKAHVDAVMGGRVANFDAMPASQVAVVFDAAAAIAKAANTAPATRPFDVPQGQMTAARMQARIVERRKEHRA